MRPELPFLAAGAVAITGGAIREHKWPSNASKAVIGTIALTLVASATSESRFAPLVHAVGLLLLLTAVMAAVSSVDKAKAKKKGK
jgi:dolichol kinase